MSNLLNNHIIHKYFKDVKISYDIPVLKNEIIMLDLETDIKNNQSIVLAQLYVESHNTVYIIKQPSAEDLLTIMLNNHWVAHNATFELNTVMDNLTHDKYRISDINNWDCTFLLAKLAEHKIACYNEVKRSESLANGLSLDSCAYRVLGFDIYSQLGLDKKKLQRSFKIDAELTEDQILYAALDVLILDKVYEHYWKWSVDTNYVLDKLCIKYFNMLHLNGLPVDKDRVTKILEAKKYELDTLLPKCDTLATSPKQVSEFFGTEKADVFTLKDIIKNKEGRYDDYQVDQARTILAIRKAGKSINTLNKYLAADRYTGYIAPKAVSGRTTSTDNNLQQIDRAFKECFGVKENNGTVLVYSDFSQLELRCACIVVKEQKMIKLYSQKADLHTHAAKEIFKVNTPTKEQRDIAKTLNFGLLYGAGARTVQSSILADNDLSEEQAEGLLNGWRRTWPDLYKWQLNGFQNHSNNVTCNTALKRRFKPQLGTQQLNLPVQGTGAEVSKLALIYMMEDLIKDYSHKWSIYGDVRTWFVNYIHDSYMFEIPNDKRLIEEFSKLLAKSMRAGWKRISHLLGNNKVDMPVEVFVGYNWGDIEAGNYIHTLKVEGDMFNE